MSRNQTLYWLAATGVLFIMSSCATFEPGLRTTDAFQNRPPTATASRNGLEVAIEEFVTSTKSQLAFDANVAGEGVMAIFVRVDNKSPLTYRLPRTEFTATLNSEPLVKMDGKTAAEFSAGRSYTGSALGWTLATGPFALLLAPVALAGSGEHTRSVNRRIEEHFGNLEFPDTLLRPNQSNSGFVYFVVPVAIKRLENVTLQIQPVNDASGEKNLFTFPLPPMDVELPRRLRDRAQDNP